MSAPADPPPVHCLGTVARELLQVAQDLTLRGEPYAIVTVLRAMAPSSAYAGAQAIVRGDGSLGGWIGGGCARQVVVQAALEAIARGAPRLVRIANDTAEAIEDVASHRMPCASNGQLELFIHPYVAAPRLQVVGATPVAEAARGFAQGAGFSVSADPAQAPAQLVLIATQGDGDEAALEQALRGPARHVLMVASARKAEVLRERMRARGIDAQQLARLEAPAGPDLGARMPAEIALAAVAGAVAWWRRSESAAAASAWSQVRRLDAAPAAPAAAPYVNPVCGMKIDPAQARHTLDYAGTRHYFCCDACKIEFERDPARYAGGGAPAAGRR
jgi:xanthine dehydrogenase accessory factor